ncbi:hypothetical protein [Portibacter lacus]|uniref:Tetratricopeptide repeat protein n=1 Tax=Portibacter lacus TaxID=1099794 RepID=A0AA37SPB3_9BACT|nr:hypothetical protein [Portibacter lacus]GLR17507.1 hypothetical protein GCM10007940_21220 [Portibacter lacus]
MIRLICALSLSLIIFSCTPKVAKVVEEAPVEQKPVYEGNCPSFADITPAEKDEAETAYVLYKDFLRTKNYDESYKYWQTAMRLAPRSNGRIQYQFDDGLKIFKHYHDTATDSVVKKEWADKAMALYDQRVECFGDEYYLAGRQAFDMFYNYRAFNDDQEIYELFKKAIDGQGDSTGYFVVNPFTKLLVENIFNEKITMDEGKKYANKILDIIEYGNANCEKDKICDAWKIINDYSPARLEALEGYKGFYDCEYYTNKYYQEFLDSPEDCETIVGVYVKLKYGGCSESSEAFQAVSAARQALCMKQQEAVAAGPLRKAYDAYNEGDFKAAVDLFKEYVDGSDDPEKRAKYNLLISKLYYRDLKNFSQARKYALAAAADKPNWGEPYVLIGKLYASSGPLCGPGTGFDSQIVTWPAIDKWQYAKKIDPTVADEANKLIRTYTQYMPKKEDIFSRSIKAGSSYKIGCWIQESTIVRTAN